MNTALWIVAWLLAAVFLLAGCNKLFIPREKLAKAPGGAWVLDFSAGFVKALGALEMLGAIGLILPAAARYRAGSGAAGRPGSGLDHDRRGDRGVPPSGVQARTVEPDLPGPCHLRNGRPLLTRVIQRLTGLPFHERWARSFTSPGAACSLGYAVSATLPVAGRGIRCRVRASRPAPVEVGLLGWWQGQGLGWPAGGVEKASLVPVRKLSQTELQQLSMLRWAELLEIGTSPQDERTIPMVSRSTPCRTSAIASSGMPSTVQWGNAWSHGSIASVRNAVPRLFEEATPRVRRDLR